MPTPESSLMLKHLPIVEVSQELPPERSALILPPPVPRPHARFSIVHKASYPACLSSAWSAVFVWVSEGEGGWFPTSGGLCLAQP